MEAISDAETFNNKPKTHVITTRRRRTSAPRPGPELSPREDVLSRARAWWTRLAQKRTQHTALVLFYRGLATLYAAGVRIDRALDMLGRQCDHPIVAGAIQQVSLTVSNGAPLSAAMALQGGIFPSMHVSLVRVGETTGRMDLLLARLAEHEEKLQASRARVKSALVYPMFLCLVALAVLVVVPPFLMGGMLTMVESANVELPWITKVVLALSHAVRSPFFYLAFGTAAAASWVALRQLFLRWGVRLKLLQWMHYVPAVGRFLTILGVARFARSLDLLLSVGVNSLRSLGLAAEATGSPMLEMHVMEASDCLRAGLGLPTSLRIAGYFPSLFLQMVEVGDQTGKIPEMLARTAAIYDQEVEQALDRFTAMLEPLVLLAMGIVVGILVVATMLPMIQMIQNL